MYVGVTVGRCEHRVFLPSLFCCWRELTLLSVCGMSPGRTPHVLAEARKISPERVKLLGQMTAELLVKAG
mgnify:CR=1 FL=1